MNEQIRELRKTLKLTQQGFSDRLGVKRNTVAQWEIGVNNLSDQVVRSICREFNVNETWLRTGEGEMFVYIPTDALDTFIRERNLSASDRILIEKFATLDAGSRQVVVEYVLSVAEEILKNTAQEGTEPDIAAELAELKRQNQELAAKVAAMEEEDARMEAAERSSASEAFSEDTKLA